MFAEKNKQPIHEATNSIRTKLSLSSSVNNSLHSWVQITKADNWKFGTNSKDRFDQKLNFYFIIMFFIQSYKL